VLGGTSRSIARWKIHVSDVCDLVKLLLEVLLLLFILLAHVQYLFANHSH
jgi:hypothetical protein